MPETVTPEPEDDLSYVNDLPDDPQPGAATAGEMVEDVTAEDEALASENPPDLHDADGGAE